ncbi:MAG TPA: hypothetical protein PK842_04090 [Smithella sp.]|jgi:hypothetical protein|nr:hypothetical protein [Smithella sp.]NMC96650.1 hypothetical protein [Deltaproteobacteria bacterium]HNQ65787.1 hypothetical protein [Smithella sp.]HOE33427.1 hypothetical protein [Smithella sp.]HOG09733.1 hypothetical protein [Smithella sp.]
MTKNEISREEIIKKLVDSDLDGLSQEKSIKFLVRILHNGWKGYNEMSDTELLEAFNHREFRKTVRT